MANFLSIFLGSTSIGVAIGLASALLYKHTKMYEEEFEALEMVLLLLFPYMAWMLAEALELSGIVAILFCGIVMAHYTSHNLHPSTEAFSKKFFKVTAAAAAAPCSISAAAAAAAQSCPPCSNDRAHACVTAAAHCRPSPSRRRLPVPDLPDPDFSDHVADHVADARRSSHSAASLSSLCTWAWPCSRTSKTGGTSPSLWSRSSAC